MNPDHHPLGEPASDDLETLVEGVPGSDASGDSGDHPRGAEPPGSARARFGDASRSGVGSGAERRTEAAVRGPSRAPSNALDSRVRIGPILGLGIGLVIGLGVVALWAAWASWLPRDRAGSGGEAETASALAALVASTEDRLRYTAALAPASGSSVQQRRESNAVQATALRRSAEELTVLAATLDSGPARAALWGEVGAVYLTLGEARLATEPLRRALAGSSDLASVGAVAGSRGAVEDRFAAAPTVYDVAAWNLALALGLTAWELGRDGDPTAAATAAEAEPWLDRLVTDPRAEAGRRALGRTLRSVLAGEPAAAALHAALADGTPWQAMTAPLVAVDVVAGD